jgi:copper chaperone CopZ
MRKTITLIIAVLMTAGLSSLNALASGTPASMESMQKKPKKQKAEVKDVTFLVHLHCENCVAKVVDNISRAKGVKDLDVSLEKQTVAIKYDAAKTSEDVLKAAIEKLGYPVSGKAEHGHEHHHHHDGHDHGHKH